MKKFISSLSVQVLAAIALGVWLETYAPDRAVPLKPLENGGGGVQGVRGVRGESASGGTIVTFYSIS